MDSKNGTPVIDNGNPVDVLAQRLVDAKANLEVARRAVNEAEAAIVEFCGNKPEGSQSIEADRYKVTTTGKVNRKLDEPEVKRLYLEGEIPEAIYNRLFTWAPKLNLSELRFVENNEPDLFKKLARAITSTPGKTTVAVKPI